MIGRHKNQTKNLNFFEFLFQFLATTMVFFYSFYFPISFLGAKAFFVLKAFSLFFVFKLLGDLLFIFKRVVINKELIANSLSQLYEMKRHKYLEKKSKEKGLAIRGKFVFALILLIFSFIPNHYSDTIWVLALAMIYVVLHDLYSRWKEQRTK